MRSINLKSDLSFLKILKYTCFYSVTGLIKLVQLFFTLTASETRIWRVLGTPGNVGADVLGFNRCKTHPIPQHELLVVQWTVQKASGEIPRYSPMFYFIWRTSAIYRKLMLSAPIQCEQMFSKSAYDKTRHPDQFLILPLLHVQPYCLFLGIFIRLLFWPFDNWFIFLKLSMF